MKKQKPFYLNPLWWFAVIGIGFSASIDIRYAGLGWGIIAGIACIVGEINAKR